jgi:hypothetical protein
MAPDGAARRPVDDVAPRQSDLIVTPAFGRGKAARFDLIAQCRAR